MSRHMAVSGSVVGTLLMLLTAAPAHAQWLAANPCTSCAIPVAQPCYRTVPVTEYRQIKQIVQRPVCETKYVDQTVTAYRPITEQRTVDVPTVNYENVSECRTVYKNCGYWRTRTECRYLPSPCEYDPRPDLFGWLNRTAYSIRATFTPRVAIHREYVPRVVAQQIPVTRTIAHHGVRRVTYNVTRMEPYATTRKVAVNTVRYVAQEIVHTQPVTVWRTVPIGTTIAYAVPSYATAASVSTVPQTALAPSPDPVSNLKRTATSTNNKIENAPKNDATRKFDDGASSLDPGRLNGLGTGRSKLSSPLRISGDRSARLAGFVEAPARRRLPSIVQTSRWISRNRHTAGPALVNPGVTIARNGDQ
jgi:hypothetical protein